MLKPWYVYRPTMAWRSLKARMRTAAPGERTMVKTGFSCRLKVDANEALGEQFEPLNDVLLGRGYTVWRIDYDLFGLKLRDSDEVVTRRFESPNYLAARGELPRELAGSRRGWVCLRP